MLGLLKYELSCLKKITYTFLIFLVIYGIFSIMSKTHMESRLFIIFFSVFFVIGALAQWEQYKWDILAGTLPISRKQIVIASFASDGVHIGNYVMRRPKDGGLAFNIM